MRLSGTGALPVTVWPFAVPLVLAWAVWARFIPLTAHETVQWELAALPSHALIPALAAQTCQAPLFSETLSALYSLGVTPQGARLAMALLSATLCFWLARVGALSHPRATWFLALGVLGAMMVCGVAFSLSPLLLASVFAAMAIYYFLRWQHTRRPEASMAWHLGLLLALYAHTGALLLWLSFALAFWHTRWHDPAFCEVFRRRWGWNQALIAVFWLPACLLALSQAPRCGPALWWSDVGLWLMLAGAAWVAARVRRPDYE